MTLHPPAVAGNEPHSPLEKVEEAAIGSAALGRNVFVLALLIAIAAATGIGLWTLSRQLSPQLSTFGPAREKQSTLSASPKSIAVLPFQNLSSSKEDAFLAFGVQDDILTALSKVGDLKVINRTSLSSYAAAAERNLREIGEALDVTYVLEGTVERTADKVRITARLTDARNNSQLWAEAYERGFGEIFAVQREIVQQILSQLKVTIARKDNDVIAERPTKDLVAYGLYVRAKALLASVSLNAQINEKIREAIQLLEQAVARDPEFYRAYCQLAAAHDYLYFFGLDHTPDRLAAAEAALKIILRLRPDAGESHLARANFYYRCYLDYARARTELALAQRALPNNAEIFELTGYIDRRQGLWNESARSLQRALELDPRNFFMLQQIALSYQEFRQFGAMAAALDRALAVIPSDVDTRLTRALVDLEWKANCQPLHELVQSILQQDPAAAPDLAGNWFYVALCERDHEAASRALTAMAPSGTSIDLNFPRSWCEGLAARARGDASAAESAFLAARVEVEKAVREQPDYAPALCVLGLTDAALGRKQDAIREGRCAIELLPLSRDSIDGAELVKYLAVIYAWCGEKELAIQQIAATLKIPSTLSYGNLRLHPNWDVLRGDPQFEKIVAELAPKNGVLH